LDEIPEAMVITLLRAERRHADDSRPFAHAAHRQIVGGPPDGRSDILPLRRELAPKRAECPCGQLG
jgi:hypothetical protein